VAACLVSPACLLRAGRWASEGEGGRGERELASESGEGPLARAERWIGSVPARAAGSFLSPSLPTGVFSAFLPVPVPVPFPVFTHLRSAPSSPTAANHHHSTSTCHCHCHNTITDTHHHHRHHHHHHHRRRRPAPSRLPSSNLNRHRALLHPDRNPLRRSFVRYISAPSRPPSPMLSYRTTRRR